MCTAAATGRAVKLTKPRISPTQIINCVLLMLTIVRLRPSFLEEWNKGPSVVADCSIGYYSCFTGFFTAQFTRSVGDLQLSNTSSTPKIGQKGNNYCVKLQQLSSDLSDFPACSTDVRFGSKADICSAIRHVRFTPESDIKCDIVECPLRAKSRHRSTRRMVAACGSAHVAVIRMPSTSAINYTKSYTTSDLHKKIA